MIYLFIVYSRNCSDESEKDDTPGILIQMFSSEEMLSFMFITNIREEQYIS